MTRELDNDPTAKIRPLIPETIAVVSRFMRDPGLERWIPQSSSTGRRISLWPGFMSGANGIPVGTLVRLGGADAAIWGNDFSSTLQTLDDGTVEATQERPGWKTCCDDFEIAVARTTGYEWGEDEPTFMLAVRYVVDEAPGESRLIGLMVTGLDDARLARLVEIALDARRYRLTPRGALLALRDHATCFGAVRAGPAWCVPNAHRLETAPVDELGLVGPSM
ncbi:hypothetical protein ACVIGB_000498 [Bradyrhizobium sp. USDA 4341]